LKSANPAPRCRRIASRGLAVAGLALLLFGRALSGASRWTSHGPYGGRIGALAIDPTNPAVLYAAGGYNGFFKTTDAAETWSATGQGLPANDGISVLAVDPLNSSTIYAGTTDEGLFKSTDGGGTWLGLGFDFINAIAIDPRNSRVVYTLAHYENLEKSLDGGATWTRVSGLPPVLSGLAMVVAHPDVLYVLGVNSDVDTTVRVYRTADAGATWAAAGSPNDARSTGITVDPISSRISVATEKGVFRSADAGATWSRVLEGYFGSVVAIRASEVYAWRRDAPGAVFQSTDGGDHWTSLPILPTDGVVAGSPMEPATVYLGLPDAGVGKSTDAGATWSLSSHGIQGLYATLAMDPARPADVYAGSSAGLFHTGDGGNTWLLINPAYQLNAVSIQPGTLDLFSPLGRSTDGGLNWQPLAFPLGDPTAPAIPSEVPQTLFVGNGVCLASEFGQVYKSTDGGATWTLSLDSGSKGCTSLLVSSRGSEIFAKVAAFPFENDFQSHDGGASWSPLDFSGWPDHPYSVEVLAIDPTDPSIVYAMEGGSLWVSRVGGGQWQSIGSGLPPVLIENLVIDPTSPSTLYAATFQGVYRSADHGGTWAPFGDGLPVGPGSGLVIDSSGRFLHVAAGGTVYDYEISGSCENIGNALCLLGGRFLAAVQAIDPRSGRLEVGTAVAQTDRWGYFSLPGFTSDPNFPEIVVKMADATSFGEGFWVFHSGLTDLQYTLSIVDTVTGRQKSYQNDRSDPQSLCGGADTGTFTEEPVDAPATAPRAARVLPGEGMPSLTLLGRFEATLTAFDPRTGRTENGLALAQDARWGYFSLPAFTGAPSFPEVFVKMLDGTSLGGFFWLFHTGLTDLEYTLTVTDHVSGAQKTYVNDRSDPSRLCGGADTAAFRE
jgi:photosystem II stability/assembly factor-like uncharacterized protein